MKENVGYTSLGGKFDKEEEVGRLDYYKSNGNIAFAYDLNNGVCDEFRGATALCSMVSWRYGYGKFLRKVGIEVDNVTEDYKRHLGFIVGIVEELGVPAYITTQPSYAKKLGADRYVEVKAWHGHSGLAIWNDDELVVTDEKELEDYVAVKYSVVLDFCCGYGRQADMILASGHNFIFSDINPHCIYEVAKRYMGYDG